MKDTATDNALLLPPIEQVALAFRSKEALEAVIAKIEADCRAEHYTIATRDGRDRIKAQAYKIARSNTALDDVGKGLSEEARKLVESTNALRRIATTRMDALKDEIRAPLTKWEDAEDARKQAIKDRIGVEFGHRALPSSSAALREIQNQATLVELDDTFGEFLAEAAKAKDDFLRHLAGKIEEAVREEDREAELARLRASEAKRAEEEAARRKAEGEAEAKRKADEAAAKQREDQARAEIEAERAALAAEREAMNAEVAARDAAKEAENARLRAELEAMKQQPLPEPVGEKVTAEDPVAEVEPIAMSGDNFSVVATITPSIEREISAAVAGIIKQCHSHAAMADEVASAIVAGEIPYVQVKK